MRRFRQPLLISSGFGRTADLIPPDCSEKRPTFPKTLIRGLSLAGSQPQLLGDDRLRIRLVTNRWT